MKASIDWHRLPPEKKPDIVVTGTDQEKKNQASENEVEGKNEGSALTEINGLEVNKEPVHGFVKKLDWTLVDYSTATTFILFFGFLLITRGLLIIIQNRQELVGNNFPFSQKSDMIIVNLGLIGTLWGLIMIGFYDLESIKMPQLITCLKTALWSTLLALIWAYILQPAIIVPLMNYWNNKVNNLKPIISKEDEDLEDLLDRFRKSLSGLTDIIVGLKPEMSNFKVKFADLNMELKDAIKSLREYIQSNVNPLVAEIRTASQETAKLSKANATTCERIVEASSRHGNIAEKQFEAISLLSQRLAETHGKYDAAVAENKSILGQLSEAEKENAMLRQALEAIRNQAEKPATKPRKFGRN